MRHEIIFDEQPLPNGYHSWSLLLIPDERWLHDQPPERVYTLFRRFKQLGDIIGPRHLSAWFYTTYIGSYGRWVDLEVFSAVHEFVSSDEELQAFLRKEPRLRASDKLGQAPGGYDIARAKHACSHFGLSFNSGPYIA